MNVMTEEIRKALNEYLELSGTTQRELARAVDKLPQTINKAVTGNSGKLPDLWEDILQAAGMKLVMVPKDADINAFELVKQKALNVRGREDRVRKIDRRKRAAKR